MPGQATLTKLCSFTQVIPGYNTAAEPPVPVFFNVLMDAAGNPIPTDSTAYPVGDTGFTGDGSGFIRSFYTGMDLSPATGVVFAPGGSSSTTNASLVIVTKSLLAGALIVRYVDDDEDTPPTVSLTQGLLSLAWDSGQTPISVTFTGDADDLSSNEIVVENIGGKNIANHSQTDADGVWPRVFYQKRNRVNATQPFEQVTANADSGITVFDLPITTAGTRQVRVAGLSGDFGLKIFY